MIVHSDGDFVPQQLEPVPATPVDGYGEQCLADEVKQSTGHVDRERLWKVTRSNRRNMPKPIMMTGSFQSPVMYIFMSCPSRDNVMEAQVYNRKNPRPVPIISRTCLVVNGSMYHL